MYENNHMCKTVSSCIFAFFQKGLGVAVLTHCGLVGWSVCLLYRSIYYSLPITMVSIFTLFPDTPTQVRAWSCPESAFTWTPAHARIWDDINTIHHGNWQLTDSIIFSLLINVLFHEGKQLGKHAPWRRYCLDELGADSREVIALPTGESTSF